MLSAMHNSGVLVFISVWSACVGVTACTWFTGLSFADRASWEDVHNLVIGWRGIPRRGRDWSRRYTVQETPLCAWSALSLSTQVPSKAEEITIPGEVTPEKVPTHLVDYSCELVTKHGPICLQHTHMWSSQSRSFRRSLAD